MNIEMDKKEYQLRMFSILFLLLAILIMLISTVLVFKEGNTVYAINVENANVSKVTLSDILLHSDNVTEKIEIVNEDIPFTTVSIGKSRSGTGTIITEGAPGIKEITYKNVYVNDELVKQNEIGNAIALKPASQVISYASSKYSTSRGNIILRQDGDTSIPVASYTKLIKMRYTAYCLCSKCCGKSPSNPAYGLTATGYRITPGQNDKVVAVDPKVVKLGSTVYVQGLDVKGDYGYAYACDTGGAIKGNRIDLYYDSHKEALKIGTGYCNVYVLD